MKSFALALLAACATPTRPAKRPSKLAPATPVVTSSDGPPENCRSGSDELLPPPPDRYPSSVTIGQATVSLAVCHTDEEWYVFLVRIEGDRATYQRLALDVGVSPGHFGDAQLVGVIPDSPIVMLYNGTSGEGLGREEILLDRVDGVPTLLDQTFGGEAASVEIGAHEVVISTCSSPSDGPPRAIDCATAPERFVTHTLRWVGGKLEVSP